MAALQPVRGTRDLIGEDLRRQVRAQAAPHLSGEVEVALHLAVASGGVEGGQVCLLERVRPHFVRHCALEPLGETGDWCRSRPQVTGQAAEAGVLQLLEQ